MIEQWPANEETENVVQEEEEKQQEQSESAIKEAKTKTLAFGVDRLLARIELSRQKEDASNNEETTEDDEDDNHGTVIPVPPPPLISSSFPLRPMPTIPNVALRPTSLPFPLFSPPTLSSATHQGLLHSIYANQAREACFLVKSETHCK